MTTDLENILNRICLLRTLEMAFQSTKISKLVAGPFSVHLIRRWLKKKPTISYT